ncbi:MAG: hypothetical protein JXO22_08300, partial [Phycisphaerae bacterium]|nr:hypothetical protein [Phycisphaerae bacterium]
MRHAVFGRRLSRSTSHRLALRRNMVQSLIEHGEIRTTIVKAKEIRRFAERVVQLAVDAATALDAGNRVRAVTLRQRAIALLNDRQIIAADQREDYDAMSDAKRARVLRSRSGRRYRASTTKPGIKFTSESVIHRLFGDVGPRMMKRNAARNCGGGYTRIIKLADRRLGDGGELAILQLVGEDDVQRPKNSTKTERKRKTEVRYTAYAGKPIRRRGARRATKAA